MEQLAQLPDDLVFYTQITMEAAEDPVPRRDAGGAHPRRAGRRGSGDPAGLKDVYKGSISPATRWSRDCVRSAATSSMCWGRSSSVFRATRSIVQATVTLAEEADLTFAQFVLLTPFPGTLDFDKWAAKEAKRKRRSMACR